MTICPTCTTGRLQKRRVTYVEWHENDLLVIDRMPAHVCDSCGERIYDRDAMENLQRLLWSPTPQTSRVAVS